MDNTPHYQDNIGRFFFRQCGVEGNSKKSYTNSLLLLKYYNDDWYTPLGIKNQSFIKRSIWKLSIKVYDVLI